MSKKALGLFMVFALVVSLIIATAHAESDKVSFSGDFDKVIDSDEIATFELILNNNNAPDNIELSIKNSFDWEVEFSESELSVMRGDEKEFAVTFTPPEKVEAKTYYFELVASHGEESLGGAALKVSVGEDVTPIILKKLEFPNDVLPGQEYPLTLTLYNNNFYPETDIKISISSSALDETFSVLKSFDGKETKTIAGKLAIASFLDAGEYTLIISCLSDRSYTIYEQKITVPNSGSMVVKKDVDYSFLKSTHTVTITNKAKYNLEDTYKLDVGGASRFFTFVSPQADRTDGSVHEFDISLASGESKIIQYNVSYVPLIIGLVLIAFLAIWFYSRKKCSIKKRVLAIKAKDGESMIKISLIIKNKTYRTLKDLQVVDNIPSSLKLIHKASSMKPDIVKQHGARATLTWKIPSLGPREERIVSYYIKANVRLIGRVSLPPAELLVKLKRRREKYISNTALLRAA